MEHEEIQANIDQSVHVLIRDLRAIANEAEQRMDSGGGRADVYEWLIDALEWGVSPEWHGRSLGDGKSG